jgi:hypothetical protein
MKTISKLLILTLAGISTGFVAAHAQNPNNSQSDADSRQITLDRFNKARPAADASGGDAKSTASTAPRNRNRANTAAARPPVYRRTTPARAPAAGTRKSTPEPADEIGVTVWRLRPSRSADQGARVLVLDGPKQSAWTPERIEADTPLNIGERVRLSVESPHPGYLYIVDREQYADGSFGDAMLIFPTLRTRGGDNLVEPGRLIDIPAQEDQYSYFTAQPSGARRDQVAEVLTIIVMSTPLNLKIVDQPLQISRSQIAKWEKLWGGATEVLELVGGAGQTWTNAEKEAGVATGRSLTQGDPSPQTVYRVPAKAAGKLLVTVPLRYGR